MPIQDQLVRAFLRDAPQEQRNLSECFRRADHGWMTRQPQLAMKYVVPYQILSYSLWGKDFDYSEDMIDELHFQVTNLDFLIALYYLPQFAQDPSFKRTPACVIPSSPDALRELLLNAPRSVISDEPDAEDSPTPSTSTSTAQTTEDIVAPNFAAPALQIYTCYQPPRDVSGRPIIQQQQPPQRSVEPASAVAVSTPSLTSSTSGIKLRTTQSIVGALLDAQQSVPLVTRKPCNCRDEPTLLEFTTPRSGSHVAGPFNVLVTTNYTLERCKTFSKHFEFHTSDRVWPNYVPFAVVTDNLLFALFCSRHYIIANHQTLDCLGALVAGDAVSLNEFLTAVLMHAH